MEVPEAINDLRHLQVVRGKRIWKPFMEKYNCQIICEVGVFAGRNFGRMIEHTPILAVAVDAWRDDGLYQHNDSGFTQQALENEYHLFVKRMREKAFVHIYRQYSLEAVNHFPNEYFDFVYIDADHTYEGTWKDLQAWFPKVKKGKFFIGDDYNRTQYPSEVVYDVKGAVNDFARLHNIAVYEIPGNEWASGWAIIK